MATRKIISLGSINADFQVRADRWPAAGETLLARDFTRLSGGKAANVAYLARRLDVDVLLLGRVGDDVLADQALHSLLDLHIDLNVIHAAGSATGVAMIVVRSDGQKTIILAPNANGGEWSKEDDDLVVDSVAQAPEESIFVADFEIPVATVRHAIRAARDCGFPVVIDPSPAARVPEDSLTMCDFVTPNPAEAEQLTGITVESPRDAVRAGRVLVSRGAKTVYVKLREGGCVLVGRDGSHFIRPCPTKVVDTTGAGDAFAGALAVALLEGRDPLEAGRWAVAASLIAVTRYGSQPSYPSRAELVQSLNRLPSA